ncbi:MAG: hypothetical protein JWP98_1070 [Edaphobacter sp.]|nr:hypothetical protein [Edaphobacter sp.]
MMNSEVPMPKAAIARATSGGLVRRLWGWALAGFLLGEAIHQLQHKCCRDEKYRSNRMHRAVDRRLPPASW